MLFVRAGLVLKTWLARLLCMLVICAMLAGCNEDLHPSDTDERPEVIAGSIGYQTGQTAADFTVSDSEGNAIVLADELAMNSGVVLYFTMWCPLCDTHMSNLRSSVQPDYPNVRFLIVDYVSGSVARSRSAQLSNGYASETVLSDQHHLLLTQFNATMGTTIVIDSLGRIQMNEDYKQSRLGAVLGAL